MGPFQQVNSRQGAEDSRSYFNIWRNHCWKDKTEKLAWGKKLWDKIPRNGILSLFAKSIKPKEVDGVGSSKSFVIPFTPSWYLCMNIVVWI